MPPKENLPAAQRYHYKSDFTVVVKDPEAMPWISKGWDFFMEITNERPSLMSPRVKTSRQNGVYSGCYLLNGLLHIACDNHGLRPGRLWASLRVRVPDTTYADSHRDLTAAWPLPIELTLDGPAEGTVLVDVPAMEAIVSAALADTLSVRPAAEAEATEPWRDLNTKVAVELEKANVTERTIVPIQWTYVYDSNGEITEASNDYEIGKNYRLEADGTWNDDIEGESYASLPMTRVVEADSYISLFRNSGGVPKSGYWAIVAPETCKAVVCNTTANADADRVFVASYGAIRSLAINKAQKSDVVAIESRVTEAEERLTEQQLERYHDIGDLAYDRHSADTATYGWYGLHAAGTVAEREAWKWVAATAQNNNDVVAITCFLTKATSLANAMKAPNLRYFDGTWTDTSACVNITSMFYNDTSLEVVENVAGWDTSKVTQCNSVFRACSPLKSLDISGWKLPLATTLSALFMECHSLGTVDISGWNSLPLCADFKYFFRECRSLKKIAGIETLDVSAATELTDFFRECNVLESLDLSAWDTAQNTTIHQMFLNCYALAKLDISGWDTSPLAVTTSAFLNCTSLRYVAMGWKCFKTTAVWPFFVVSTLGLTESGTSNGWVDHLADVAPWILADDADALQTQIAAFTAQYGSYKKEVSQTALEAFKAAIEDAGQHYLEDYTARTIQLPAALQNLRNADSSVMAALKLLNSKGFTISGITL